MVPASGNVWIGGQQIWLGPALSGRQITFWADAISLHVLLDGTRIKTLPSRLGVTELARPAANGARPARSLPPQPGGPITVQRRVSSRGGLMVARQKIHAGMIHAGKTATVICENTCFRVVIDGETAAVVPRTTTSEVHRYKANATDKRTLTRLTPEGH